MAEDQIKITFECNGCGGTVLSLPDDYTDESIATCKNCGIAFGTYGAINERARHMAKREVAQLFRDAFGRAGLTLK